MIVLGMDISTNTGLAVIKTPNPKPRLLVQYQGDGTGFHRAKAIADYVYRILKDYSPDRVYLENYAFGNRHSLMTLVEIGTLCRLSLEKAKVPWIPVAPTVLKKWTTGKGTATKADMMQSVLDRWGIVCKTDDAADAYALAAYGADMEGQPLQLVAK